MTPRYYYRDEQEDLPSSLQRPVKIENCAYNAVSDSLSAGSDRGQRLAVLQRRRQQHLESTTSPVAEPVFFVHAVQHAVLPGVGGWEDGTAQLLRHGGREGRRCSVH